METPRSGRRLIVNCDDFGSCLAANVAVEQALTTGIATSASLMVPCPWAYDAVLRAQAHPDWGIGIHVTLTAEWPRYRWRPLLPREQVPGLYGPDGFMWPRSSDVHSHARPEEALAEGAAQVQQALAWGLRPSHLDSHMGVLQTDPAFLDVYMTLAERFRLPLRMAGEPELSAAAVRGASWAAEARAAARARGLVFADDLVLPERRRPTEGRRDFILRVLAGLQPGTSELFFHPAVDSEELRAVTGGGADRVEDLRLLTADAGVRQALSASRIELVNYRSLAAAAG